ncbi:hypothetical protein AX15_000357 [Amanita polypyramis BW_CC]|nr:hypothetical protein AX15_000357 [Amanita polypyramis BW_CC]
MLRSTIRVPRKVTVAPGLHRSIASVSSTWLRDACQCSICVHQSTRQKLYRSSDALDNSRSSIASQSRDSDGWRVIWKDGHDSFYSQSFLERYASPDQLAKFHHQVPVQPWTKQSIQNTSSLFVTYASLSAVQGRLTAIEQILKYGILFITGVPSAKTSDNDCELRTLAEKFGQIRRTFYGTVWDVINARNSKNIAYTNLNLDLHMDLLYFHHPPRYQILHCLRNKVSGGASTFVDTLNVAETLRNRSPSTFLTLATTPVPFQYINDGHHLYHAHPTIELDPLQKDSVPLEERNVKYVNYSPPFQAPFPLMSGVDQLYTSLRNFVDLLDSEENRYEYTLREGDAVLFDNRRVLHARTAFQDIPEVVMKEGDVSRWLKGCYLDDDTMMDRFRVMSRGV